MRAKGMETARLFPCAGWRQSAPAGNGYLPVLLAAALAVVVCAPVVPVYADAFFRTNSVYMPPPVGDVEAPGPAGMSDLEMLLFTGIVLALIEGFFFRRLIRTRRQHDGG